MKNLAILLIVLAGLLFASKIYIEKRYESKLDDVISTVGFFANISYDSVKVDFDGSISLNGLKVSSPQLEGSLAIQKIRAISSDPLMAFNGFSTFKDGKFPETFDLSITQMDLPIAGIERLSKTLLPSNSGSSECRDFATTFNYTGAGYSTLLTDLRVALDFSDVYNTVVNFDGFDETSSFELEWVLDASQVESVVYGGSKELPVSEINVDYKLEPDAAKRFVKYCADEFKVTPDVFLEKVIGSAKYSENSFGHDFGPQVEQLKFYKPKDILRWLNLTASLDGEQLPLRESVLAAEEQAKADDDETKVVEQAKYAFINADDAESYVGRWVRIYRTLGRKKLQGKLSGVTEEERLMVDMYQHGGLMTLTVGIDEIETIEVLKK